MSEKQLAKKVLLIYPPTQRLLREDRCQIPARNALMSPQLPPTDLMYLAAVAEHAGCVCEIADYSGGKTADDFVQDLKAFRPDYLLISAATPTLVADAAHAALAREVLPDVVTMAKGAHFLKFDLDVLAANPTLDMVIRGEPELTFGEVLSGRPRREITGLTWRGPQGVVRNPDRPPVEDLDLLPLPARHLVDNRIYVRPDTGDPLAVVKVSRGCPYHCFFCLATPVYGSKVRMRSPGNIVEEIRTCVERYHIGNFIFWSDFFTWDREWVLELCREIKDAGLGISWSANTRAGAVDQEMARAMREAGCSLVSVGVESGSQYILDRIGKRVTVDQVRETFGILRAAGLTTLAYYLVGLPWETRETAGETRRLSLDLDSDFASFFVATPLPGTRFFDYAAAHGLFEGGNGDVAASFRNAYFAPAVRGHFIGREEIEMLRRTATRRFLFRPGYVLKNVARVRSWRELARYAAAAASFLANGK